MGLYVEIFRHPLGDCTNNGASKFAKGFCVENVPGPFKPSKDYPAANLREKTIAGEKRLRLIPKENDNPNQWVMFGGNLAYTSDSRWSQTTRKMVGYPVDAVKIFDRVE